MSETYDAQYEEADQVTGALDDSGKLEVSKIALQAKDDDIAGRQLRELFLRAGRIQASKVVASFAESLTVSELREIKSLSKAAGVTWGDACQTIGISTQTADRYLRLANDLGDDFLATASEMGISVRALETARKLPEEARQRLLSGDVVDLTDTTKEQLTRVIREMAAEHQGQLDETKKELKSAERKAQKAESEIASLEEELALAKQGLSADDAQALEQVKGRERGICAYLVTLKNTLDIADRDPHTTARIVGSLDLMARMAEATAAIILARAEGQEPNEEMIMEPARRINDELAEADDREPHPGV